MKKKLTLVLVVLLMCIWVLSACNSAAPDASGSNDEPASNPQSNEQSGEQSEEDDKLVIGMAMMIMAHPFGQDIYAGAMSVADEHNAEILLVDGNFDVTTQMNGLDDIIATGKLDALFLWGVDSNSIVPAIQECNNLGIPVISVDVLPSGGETIAHVSSDNFEIGANAGQYAIECLKERYDGEVKGKVVLLNAPHINTMNDRTQGFLSAFDDIEGVEFIEKTVTDVNSDTFLALVDDVITANPKGTIDIIFGANSTAGVPAISGLEAAGRTDCMVISVDACDEFSSALEKQDGVFKGYVAQDGISIGIEAMKCCIQAAKGELTDFEDIAVPSILVTDSNYKEFNDEYAARREALAEYYYSN